MRQAAVGLAYLHERRVVHGDLKCGNILVVSDRTAKVTDFSFSYVRTLSASKNSVGAKVGALRWRAPECLKGRSPTFASDVYALGMCIIEATSLELPWGYYVDDDSVRDLVKSGELPEKPEQVPERVWHLVERMCAFQPAARLTLESVISELGDFATEEAELHGQRSKAAPDSVSYDSSQWYTKSTQADRNPWDAPLVHLKDEYAVVSSEPSEVATTSRQKYIILFVGGVGSGKSTILNCLARKVVFKSGISYGTGLTLKMEEYTLHGVTYMDTPNLSEPKLEKQNAAAITQALKATGNFRIFFTHRNVIFSIVINKVEKDDYDALALGQSGFQPHALRDVLSAINAGEHTTLNVFLLQKIRKLNRAKDAIIDLPQDFRAFVDSAPRILIRAHEVSAINTDASAVQRMRMHLGTLLTNKR